MIRLVCIDVDGTLVGSSGEVTPESWAAAHRAREGGIRLAVCSGRPAFGLARAYAERLDADGWHVFQNGASVLHLPDGIARSVALPAPAVEGLIARARATGRILELYSDTDYAFERDTPRSRLHASLLGVPFTTRPFESLAGPIVRAQWLVAREDADAIMAEPNEGLSVESSLSPLMPDTAFLNMTSPGVGKGSGVRSVADAYGFTLDEVMMVGDSANDISAMRIVGAAVAMGNAEDDVLAAAHRVVGHVDRGGLAEAIELALTL
jgi:Cof subfamily protein (haloacid dehalogenase superfamily)